MLVINPGFIAAAILTLSLDVGASTVIYSVAHAGRLASIRL
jgi:hypothetical protein